MHVLIILMISTRNVSEEVRNNTLNFEVQALLYEREERIEDVRVHLFCLFV